MADRADQEAQRHFLKRQPARSDRISLLVERWPLHLPLQDTFQFLSPDGNAPSPLSLDGRGVGGEGESSHHKHRPTPLAPLDAADRSDPRFPLRAHSHSPPRATAHEPGDSHRPPQP